MTGAVDTVSAVRGASAARAAGVVAPDDDGAEAGAARMVRAAARGIGRETVAARGAVFVAAAAAIALATYAALQIAGALGVAGAPTGAIPLFWRLKLAGAAGAVGAAGALGPWRRGGMTSGARARMLGAILTAALVAIAICVVFLP